MLDRQAQGRDAQPTAAMIDSQTTKAPGASCRGYYAAKRVNGAQAPYLGRYRQSVADGAVEAGRRCRFDRRAAGARRPQATLAVG